MAAKELSRIKINFVNRVSRPIILQLLDNLLRDKILGDEEKESILEENKTRANQARVLIESLIKKGDSASRKMMEHLQARDPTLCSELNLRFPEDAQPAVTEAERCNSQVTPQTEQEWSTTLIPTTEAFWREKQKDTKKVYPGAKESIRSRVALLITNIKFTNEKYNRSGAEKDEENMDKLLSALGYEVVKHTNLTAKGIEEALIEFSQHSKLKYTDSVIVVIMSHGNLEAVLGINHEPKITQDEFSLDNICKYLGPENCTALLDKPKIIIIQACRGGVHGSVLVSDWASQAEADEMQPPPSQSAEHLEEDILSYVHKEKDFLFYHSSTRDTKSYRHPVIGSLFILAIVDVFNTLAKENHIEELFKIVARYVRDCPTSRIKQMPCGERFTLDRDFYLFPGI